MLYTGDIESFLDSKNSWVFRLGVIYDGTTYTNFDNVGDMYEFMYAKQGDFFFHNLDFDLMFFIQNPAVMSNVGQNTPLITSGSKIIGTNIGGVVFRDSLCLLPMPLKKVVTSYLGVHDERYLEQKNDVVNIPLDELQEYCQKDCYYLFLGLLKYKKEISEYGITTLPYTTPSTALKIFLRRFQVFREFLHLSRRHVFFNDGYMFGGHTEKFVNGIQVFRHQYYYDVNSMYPFIMKNMEFFVGKYEFLKPSLNKLKELLARGDLFYCELEVNIDSEELRFFPSADPIEGRNRYLLGKRIYKMSELGVKFILKFGSMKNIVSVINIVQGKGERFKPFHKFVEEFYGKRKRAGGSVLWKLLLNSLYGKFAQKLERDNMYWNYTDVSISDRRLDSGVWVSKVRESTPHFNKRFNRLDVSGKCTEGARLYMGNLINQIRKKGEVIYTDTDSIFTSVNVSEVFPELVGSELGLLSNELGERDDVYLIGQKFYFWRRTGKSAHKGCKVMTLDAFREVIRTKVLIRERDVFSRFDKYIKKGFFGIMRQSFEMDNFLERLD